MARFDVHVRVGGGLLLDCQSKFLDHYNPRFVVPLAPANALPAPIPRLNPVLDIEGVPHVMMTHLASAVSIRKLGRTVATLAAHDHQIIGALDTLIGV